MSNKKIAIIGGSGIDDPQILKQAKEIKIDTPYGATSSLLMTGQINGTEVVTLARHGKKHEIMPSKVPYRANIWALKEVGCTQIIALTACGSMQENIRPGDFVFPDQFIDFTKQRQLTFFDNKVVHTSMAEPFCPQLNKELVKAADKLKLRHHQKGTVLTIEGPRFSTRAESLFFKQIGADVINMSTVPEVILAREVGICYASIAMATDYDVWREGEEAVTFEMVMKIMAENAEKVKRLLMVFVSEINSTKCNNCQS